MLSNYIISQNKNSPVRETQGRQEAGAGCLLCYLTILYHRTKNTPIEGVFSLGGQVTGAMFGLRFV